MHAIRLARLRRERPEHREWQGEQLAVEGEHPFTHIHNDADHRPALAWAFIAKPGQVLEIMGVHCRGSLHFEADKGSAR